MAEEFLEFIETTNYSKSFEDFRACGSQSPKMGDEMEAEASKTLFQHSSCPCDGTDSTISHEAVNGNIPDSTGVSSPSCFYSPVSNWTSVSSTDVVIHRNHFHNVEDSILTTLRRGEPEKYEELEERLIGQRKKTSSDDDQFKLFRKLKEQIETNLKQMDIIMNYVENKSKGKKSYI